LDWRGLKGLGYFALEKGINFFLLTLVVIGSFTKRGIWHLKFTLIGLGISRVHWIGFGSPKFLI